MTTELKQLWQEAFGDPDVFVERFFETGFSENRCKMLLWEGELAAALYWFDVFLGQRKLAYIYAVATKKQFRGKGLCRQLMENTHADLKAKGYCGAILVPGEKTLFDLYRKLGYRVCSSVREFSCKASGPCPCRQVGVQEYVKLRKALLPAGAVLQEGKCLAFLESFCQFWAGEDWLLAGTVQAGTLYVQEYLGPEDKAPHVTAASGAEKANFRMPGTDRPFAMYHPLDDAPAPRYFGLALD